MSEERVFYGTGAPVTNGLLNAKQKGDTLDSQTHSDFVDVRTRRGKLIFRFDANRMLIDWREGREAELIDLMPYLR